jgi:hypothetical protein
MWKIAANFDSYYRWRLIHEGVEGVAADFSLKGAKQFRLLHLIISL